MELNKKNTKEISYMDVATFYVTNIAVKKSELDSYLFVETQRFVE